jgi:hypothetical protein
MHTTKEKKMGKGRKASKVQLVYYKRGFERGEGSTKSQNFFLLIFIL